MGSLTVTMLTRTIAGGLHALDVSLGARIDSVNSRIDSVEKTISARFDTVNAKIDGLDRDVQAPSIKVFGSD
jgi:hypothetical protein